MNTRTLCKVALVSVVLLLALLPGRAAAGVIAPSPICTNFLPSINGVNFGLINQANVVLSNRNGGAQSILTISLLIILLMLTLTGMLYAIGYAFKIDRLLRISKAEIGEALITMLIVLMTIGTFAIGTASIGPQNLFALGRGAFNTQLFQADCSLLVQNSFGLVPQLLILGLEQEGLTILGSLSINIAPYDFGFSFEPLDGLVIVSQIITILIGATAALTAITLGSAIFLSIIYNLFPIFLYTGIILRTLPWTRAAGGAFIGLFIAFYIMFPILMFTLTTGYLPYAGVPGIVAQNPVTVGSYDQITATCFSGSTAGCVTSVTNNCQLSITDSNGNAQQCTGTSGPATSFTGSGSVSCTYFASTASCYNVNAYDCGSNKATTQTLEVDSSPSNPTQCTGAYGQILGTLGTSTGSISVAQFTNPSTYTSVNLNPYATPSGNGGLINGFLYDTLEPVMYTAFAVVLSLLISFDFMEALGDLLGAPSLTSTNVLKRVI